MRITLDISPFVHQHAGLGRYAGELFAALRRVAPQHPYLGLYYSPKPLPIGPPLSGIESARVPLGPKPWRMSVLLAYSAGLNMDRWLPSSDIFHGTDHL